jgi:hypothetical protein
MEHCLVNIHIVQKKENYWCNYMSAALAHAKFIYEVNKAVLYDIWASRKHCIRIIIIIIIRG